MADEALRCFESFLESVPGWIADLEGILKAATEKQNEILFENQPADSEDLGLKRKKTKSSSLRSRRSGDERKDSGQDKVEETPPPPTLLRPQLPHLTDSDALRLSQRKRKTVSNDSGHHSGPPKFRSRAMVVLYYDGDTQKKFETLVHAIGTCRNAIRKGRIHAKVDSVSRSGSSSSESAGSDGEEAGMDLHKMRYRSARSARYTTRALSKDVSLEAFDKVDGCLEKGQSLCERAAHQILRDGDCALEVNNAKSQFKDAEEIAQAELPTLRTRAEQAARKRQRSEERRQDDDGERRNRDSENLSIRKVPSLVPSVTSDGKLEVDLEADDDSEGEDDFVVDAMQFGKYQMRTTRLLAH